MSHGQPLLSRCESQHTALHQGEGPADLGRTGPASCSEATRPPGTVTATQVVPLSRLPSGDKAGFPPPPPAPLGPAPHTLTGDGDTLAHGIFPLGISVTGDIKPKRPWFGIRAALPVPRCHPETQPCPGAPEVVLTCCPPARVSEHRAAISPPGPHSTGDSGPAVGGEACVPPLPQTPGPSEVLSPQLPRGGRGASSRGFKLNR